ncbi:MAG: hypothetical protein WC466_05730 [Candidatus Izemoplasmatales bacterium]
MNLLQKLGLVKIDGESEELPENKKENVQTEKNENESFPLKSSNAFSSIMSDTKSAEKVVGKIDENILEKLSSAIEKNNLKGNDFLEFMQSLNGLSGLSVQEDAKFKMVFTTLTASSEGLSKKVLIDSIAHYLDVLDKEKATFSNEMGDAVEKMITSKDAEIKSMEESISKKLQEIESLNKEISEMSGLIGQTKKEIENSQFVIEQKKADFDLTFLHLENKIKEYKTKIEQYI